MCIRVNQCCCCCTLQTGTKIIGWLDLLCGVSIIVWYSTEILKNENYYTSIAGIIANAVLISVTIPLLIAASKNSRPKLILPWLVFAVIQIIIITIGLLSYLPVIANIPQSDFRIADIISYSIAIIITFANYIYFWLVIYSYRQQLLDMETRLTSANQIPIML
uniref:Uncharacterized protein n=1 Tax=Daphnia galeata TaxID=27404 RepID=A0A8J2RG81_9CRUS|nr:unnamed protein product [Daphnia galeata]